MIRTIRRPLGDGAVAALCGLAALGLYACTAAPSVATIFDDSLEFQVVLPTLGIAHPSGYPLYTLLGKLAVLVLPFRDAAGRTNLLSALCAAAAVALLYLVARRIAGSRPAAVAATAAFAISPVWWSQATIAEVYALHGLLYIAAVHLLLKAEEAWVVSRLPRSGVEQAGVQAASAAGDRWLAAACFVLGLGLAHHRMIALLLPAALLLVAWADPGLLRRPRRWLRPLLMLAAPLLAYLYLPLRGQAVSSLDGAFRADAAGVADWILARGYGVFLTGNPFGVERRAGDYAALVMDQMGVLMLALAVLGLVAAWRFSRRRCCFLALAAAAQIAFAVSYKVQDVEVFFLPFFMLLAVWAAWGLAPVLDGLSQAVRARGARGWPVRMRPLCGAAWLLMVAVLLLQPAWNALHNPDLNRSRAWGDYEYGEDMLAAVAPGGRVIGLLGETTLVRYFRDVLGQRPDIGVVAADAEGARLEAVDAALAGGEIAYLTRHLPGAAERYSLDAAGPLIAVAPKALPAAAPQGRPVAPGIVLVDARAVLRPAHSGVTVKVTAAWAAAEPIAEALKISARLIDRNGRIVAQDDQEPVHFGYPTTAWAPGETVQDSYDLAPADGAAPGPCRVLLVLYRAADAGEVGRIELPGEILVQVE